VSTYVFDPNIIESAARRGIGLPRDRMFEVILDALEDKYPDDIHRDQPWVFNVAGGVMIQIKIIHASPSEYIMLWGTAIGAEGYSGRHPAEFYDTVVDGETWYQPEGKLEREVYRAGDRIFLSRGECAGMRIPDHLWAVEYARGTLPLVLPFGLADAFTSTVDITTIFRSLKIYATLSLRSMRRRRPRNGMSQALVITAAVYLAVRFLLTRRNGRSTERPVL